MGTLYTLKFGSIMRDRGWLTLLSVIRHLFEAIRSFKTVYILLSYMQSSSSIYRQRAIAVQLHTCWHLLFMLYIMSRRSPSCRAFHEA